MRVDATETVNPAPNVIPAVREWNGGTGKFLLDEGFGVILSKEDIISEAQKAIITEYFETIIGTTPKTSVGTPKNGDVYLCMVDDETLGSEGYELIADDIVTINAQTQKGLLYGVTTLLQSFQSDGYMPKGRVFDYPSYEIRSGMIDVARAYIPLSYVEEITKYFAWFKLNEIHLHINDRGSDGVGYFRLESDIEGLSSEQHYTKAEYRDYQKRMREYGIEVVTEIDTPAHSSCFASVVPEFMFDNYHIDITNPQAVDFICTLWDEYITGDDPVFVGKTVHFGTDEFTQGYNEQMRAYTDTLIKHIRSRGYTPRFWGSFGGDGFNGDTPVSGDAQVNFWAVSLSDYKTLFDMGYDVINSCGPVLYCVPGGNYGFYDYYDLNYLYKNWFVNYMGHNESTSVSPDNPQLKGACFCLWNDLWCDWGGYSMFDIFDRLRYQICLISEKAWCGEQTRGISPENFISRFDTLSLESGGANPIRHCTLPLTLETKTNQKSVGFPYLADIDVTVTDYNCDILSSPDGTLFIGSDGKPRLKRESYTFFFNYIIPKNTQTKLTLYADNRRTLLIIDDTWFYDPVNPRNTLNTASTTFVLPVETIGSDGCKVNSFTVKEPDFTPNDLLCQSNLALGKPAAVSGLEVDYLNEPLAFDGNEETRLSFARDKDEQWLQVDLGKIQTLSKVIIKFHERVSSYSLLLSEDGINYITVYEANGLEDGIRADDTAEFSPTNARYVKYVQNKRWYCTPYSTWYSGGILEFEVYGVVPDCSEVIAKAEQIDDKDIKKALRELLNYQDKTIKYEAHLLGLRSKLEQAIADYEAKTASSVADISVITDDGKNGWLLPCTIIAAAVITAAIGAVVVFKKRKKK